MALVRETTTTGALSDYKKLCVLGHGNGGTVYKVEHRSTGAIYALKVVHCSSDPLIRRRTLRERDILHQTDSPYVVRCHEIFGEADDLAILMEYMDSGTLDSQLRQIGPFSETQLSNVARQVLSGLHYLLFQVPVLQQKGYCLDPDLDVDLDLDLIRYPKHTLPPWRLIEQAAFQPEQAAWWQ